jgi:O-antigen ligase
VTGTGLNTYTRVIKKYSTTWQAYPHNSYLQMAAELGITGLLIFLWMVVAHIRSGICSRVVESSSSDSILWVGFLASLSGFLVHAFFDTTFYSVQHGILLWVLLALVQGTCTFGSQKVLKIVITSATGND